MDLIGWVIFIVALLVSVMLHETGHFVLAKKFGMKVTRYFVGFGPTIWSTWRGETEYGVKALPFGGFVKIVGMHSLDDPDDPEDEPRAFRSHPAWQRILVLCAGSAMHFLLALVLVFGLALGVGIANDNVTQVGTISPCVPVSVTAYDNGSCTGVPPDLPGQAGRAAGRRRGDRLRRPPGEQLHPAHQPDPSPPARDAGHHHRPPRREAGEPAHQAGQRQGPQRFVPGRRARGAVPGGQPAESDRVLGHHLRPGAGRFGGCRRGAPRGAAQAVRQGPLEHRGGPGQQRGRRGRGDRHRGGLQRRAGSTRSASCCCSSPR